MTIIRLMINLAMVLIGILIGLWMSRKGIME